MANSRRVIRSNQHTKEKRLQARRRAAGVISPHSINFHSNGIAIKLNMNCEVH